MCAEGYGVNLTGAIICADLGSSSKYSAENINTLTEDRCGEGFLVNCVCTWVSRS